MHPRIVILVGVLPACWKESHLPACSEPTYTDLADDEESPLGTTANDLLALATPGWKGMGLDAAESAVDVAFTVARGEGSAAFAHTELIDIVTRSFGLGDSYALIYVECHDWLEVPAELSIASEDAEIDLDMDATLTSPLSPWQGTGFGADVNASEPYESSGLVVPGIDESYDEQTIDARIGIEPDGTSDGLLSWNGTSDTRGQLVPILQWDGGSDAD